MKPYTYPHRTDLSVKLSGERVQQLERLSVVPREPWQWPRADWIAARVGSSVWPMDASTAGAWHWTSVRNAIKAGLPVSAKVLADYPNKPTKRRQ